MQAKANGLTVREYNGQGGYNSMPSPVSNGHFNGKNGSSPSHEYLPDVSAVSVIFDVIRRMSPRINIFFSADA